MSNAPWYAGGLIDVYQPSLWTALLAIFFNPLFWNTVARTEHSTRFLTKALGSPYRGCCFLGVVIFVIGIIRDHFYLRALKAQPTFDCLDRPLLSQALFVLGSTLVGSSMWKLGFTGTYLGDYFGILMDNMVTGFPFNLTQSPMYNGSTLCFLAGALQFKSPAGLLLTAIVFVVYRIALSFEDPFTSRIYAARASKQTGKLDDKSK